MARRAAWIHLGSLASTQALQFLVSLALVRLLSPHELGLFAIASVTVGVAHVVRDLGVSAYLQREPALDADKVRAALGLSSAASVALCVVAMAGAPALATLTAEPALVPLLRTLAVGLLVVPVGAVMTALALREGDAARLARVTAWGNLGQAAVAVALALAGAGAAAPAWAQLINLSVCSLVVWPLRPRTLWGPPRLRGWGPILRLGRGALPANVLSALQGAVPSLLLGHLGGAGPVGLLGRAQSLTGLLPGMAGTALQFGALGRWARAHHRGRRLAAAVAAHARRVCAVAWPALAITTALAQPLVLTLFGAAWIEAVPAIGPLALLAALAAAFSGAGPALVAVGRPGWSILPQGLTLAASLGMAATLTLPEGPAGAARFAWWLLAAGLAALPVQCWLYRRWLGLGAGLLARSLGAGALAALLTGAGAWLGVRAAPASAPLQLVAGLGVALTLWWLAARRRGSQAAAPRPASSRLRITIRK